jgi:hypothetical protein
MCSDYRHFQQLGSELIYVALLHCMYYVRWSYVDGVYIQLLHYKCAMTQIWHIHVHPIQWGYVHTIPSRHVNVESTLNQR